MKVEVIVHDGPKPETDESSVEVRLLTLLGAKLSVAIANEMTRALLYGGPLISANAVGSILKNTVA